MKKNPEHQPGADAFASPAGRIAGLYGVFALLWIYFSDRALGLLVGDPELLLRLSVYKGTAFVAVTAGLLFWLMRRAFRAERQAAAALRTHERELERLNRLYAALSQVNQAIVQLPTREELLERVCRALVDHGGFRLAWVGWHDPVTHRLAPVAVWGDENDYIRNIRVYADDRPEGRGPSGTAFRENRPCICNDMLHDPMTLPWRAEVARRGFRASAVFPIRCQDRVCGTLSVYADEPGFFQDREISLLAEAARDTSFALDNLVRIAEQRQAEAAAEGERLFSDAMIDSMPGILYFYDTAGRFLRWNRNFELISGYSGAEIARMSPLDFFAPADRPAIEARIAEVFVHGQSSVEAPFRAKDGTATPYLLTGRRVEFEGKVCLVGVGMDITERQRAEAALREMQARMQLVVENLREGLIMADPAGSFLHWNPAALRILGFTDLAEGRQWQRGFTALFELFHLDGTPLPPEEWPLARVRRGDQIDGLEIRVRRRGTEWERILSYTGSQVRYAGDRALAFMTITDITDRKQADRQLREARDHLELKVTERTEELQAALVRAEAADRIKSAFLATMSHELRTPLNSIIGFTGIVLQGLAGPLNPEQTKQLGMVRGSARHLLELINDVLDISKIEAGQLEVRAEPFDLPEAIERAAASVRPLAEKKALTLAVRTDPGLGGMVGDRRRVEQIMLNLLNNALKFTAQGGVTLVAGRIEDYRPVSDAGPGPAVRLEVTDTGIGIRREDLGKLFQPFRQVDAGLTRMHEGTGLGLVICRRLAELMGGTISVASEWGRGSVFTVTLPLQKPLPP